MRTYVALDLSELSPWPQGRSASWWGVALLIAADATVYSALIASYFYLRQNASGWPPGNIPEPSIFWPTVSTGLWLVSTLAMWMSLHAARQGRHASSGTADSSRQRATRAGAATPMRWS